MAAQFNPIQMVIEAEQRIRPSIRRTILDFSPYYSQINEANVYFKCENLQHTGSFKVRGALNKILSLREAERAKGIVTASTGNHGAACAFAMQQAGGSAIVFVPDTAVPAKLETIRLLGA
jgi:threonine dehydratase